MRTIHQTNELPFILNKYFTNFNPKKKNKNESYYNCFGSFDIETTSFYNSENGEKRACMYEWSFCLTDLKRCFVFIGRTWDEFNSFIDMLVDFFNLNENKRFIIFVHNLSFEMSFIQFRFDWSKVFALDNRKPVQCITTNGVEFRCSYVYSNYALNSVAKNLINHKIKKLIGDLDYELIRHSKSYLSKKELNYCINDVVIVVYYILEELDKYEMIYRMPLTNTGKVRKFCCDYCYFTNSSHKKSDGKKYTQYRNLMKNLTLSKDIFEMSQRCFSGGFTHAGYNNSNKILYDVYSEDVTSFYPFICCAFNEFPMSKGQSYILKSKDDFYEKLNLYACMFDITFKDLKPKTNIEHPISKSKAFHYENIVENNGRIVSGDEVGITLTNLDFKIIEKYYTWSKMEIGKFYIFEKGYLPKNLILSILDLYKDKTELKGVEDQVAEYMTKKGMLNSAYGMMVTNFFKPDYKFTDTNGWYKEEKNLEKELEKYNKNKKRFLYYLWGVWVTSISRFLLLNMIYKMGSDYVYADTDSIKFLNYEKHKNDFDDFNEKAKHHLYLMCDYYNIPYEKVEAKNLKGEIKYLGAFENETQKYNYSIFKTLGAKRYIYIQNDELHLTCSGLNAKVTLPYLKKKFKTDEKVIENFDNELFIPEDYTGKMTHTYGDEAFTEVLKDYNGVETQVSELSFCHLEKVSYSLTISDLYLNFLKSTYLL